MLYNNATYIINEYYDDDKEVCSCRPSIIGCVLQDQVLTFDSLQPAPYCNLNFAILQMKIPKNLYHNFLKAAPYCCFNLKRHLKWDIYEYKTCVEYSFQFNISEN